MSYFNKLGVINTLPPHPISIPCQREDAEVEAAAVHAAAVGYLLSVHDLGLEPAFLHDAVDLECKESTHFHADVQ